MASLASLQRTLHLTLRGEQPIGEASTALGVDPQRLKVYRGFVRQHIRGILDKIYPMTRALLGGQAWRDLGDSFFAEVPATGWELNAAAQPFPTFLDARLAGGDQRIDPFHIALARLEWEEIAVYLSPAEVPEPDSLEGPVLNPTTSALSLSYAVVPFVVEHPDPTPSTPLPARQERAQVALLFRRGGSHHVAYYHGSDDLLFALKVVHEGVPLAQAADAVGQPLSRAQAALDEALRIGLVLAPSAWRG